MLKSARGVRPVVCPRVCPIPLSPSSDHPMGKKGSANINDTRRRRPLRHRRSAEDDGDRRRRARTRASRSGGESDARGCVISKWRPRRASRSGIDSAGSFVSLGRQWARRQCPRATQSVCAVVEYDAEDVKLLDVARARGRGVIFLTSHLGAWEILCFAHSVFYEPLSFLVRPIDNPRIEELVEGLRTRFGNQPIDKKAAARTAMRLLSRRHARRPRRPQHAGARKASSCPSSDTSRHDCRGATLALRTDATSPLCAPWDENRRRLSSTAAPSSSLSAPATRRATWRSTPSVSRRHRRARQGVPGSVALDSQTWKTRPAESGHLRPHKKSPQPRPRLWNAA